MKVLLFRVKGPFAHFRRVYTTTSASTYSFPPRSAILGMIGAILGVERKNYAEHLKILKDLKVSVVIEKPIEKMRIPANFVNTKDGRRTQIPVEVIKSPSYVIAVSSENFDLFDELVNMVKNKETTYPLYLGISEFLATHEFLYLGDAQHVDPPVKIHSVLPSSKVVIKPEKGVLYLKERATRQMDEKRKFIEHETYILRKDAKEIEVESAETQIFKVGEYIITWL